ncbi:hypothetical protein PsAD46_01298 [Pseudovibrio sp. Ad46]|nr:hypothetical protein PsAD46_01298 [Pseudovibrio sp. Ad46]
MKVSIAYRKRPVTKHPFHRYNKYTLMLGKLTIFVGLVYDNI